MKQKEALEIIGWEKQERTPIEKMIEKYLNARRDFVEVSEVLEDLRKIYKEE